MSQVLFLNLFIGVFAIFAADYVMGNPIHPAVVSAMEWQPVDHECKAPRQRAFTYSVEFEQYMVRQRPG